jgi:hypothetical protein
MPHRQAGNGDCVIDCNAADVGAPTAKITGNPHKFTPPPQKFRELYVKEFVARAEDYDS